jgi:uncharacterized Tic20 family protein
MRQEQPTSDFNRSDWAILAGLFVLLGFVMALTIHLGYLTELFKLRKRSSKRCKLTSSTLLGIFIDKLFFSDMGRWQLF